MKNKSTKLAHKWLQLLGGLSEFPESEIESTAEQVSDMFYYEVLNGDFSLKNGLNRDDLKAELRKMRLSTDRWVSVVDWEGIVSLYSVEDVKTITFQVPEYLLSLIINGDDSGLSDKEIKQWENFADSLTDDEFKSGHWSYDSEDNEAYFSHTNDVTNLGGNVVDIQWVIMS